MMVDTSVYGYIFDGYYLHVDCVKDDEDTKAVEAGRATALFSHMDDNSEGVMCDGCGAYIFEPDYESVLLDAVTDIISYHRDRDDPWRIAERVIDLFGDREALIRLYLENR